MDSVATGFFVMKKKFRLLLSWALLVVFSGQALAAPMMHLCDMPEYQGTPEMVAAPPVHDCCPAGDQGTVRDRDMLQGAAASGQNHAPMDGCNFCVQCPSPATLSLFTATSVAPQGRLALPTLTLFISFPTETLFRPPIFV